MRGKVNQRGPRLSEIHLRLLCNRQSRVRHFPKPGIETTDRIYAVYQGALRQRGRRQLHVPRSELETIGNISGRKHLQLIPGLLVFFLDFLEIAVIEPRHGQRDIRHPMRNLVVLLAIRFLRLSHADQRVFSGNTESQIVSRSVGKRVEAWVPAGSRADGERTAAQSCEPPYRPSYSIVSSTSLCVLAGAGSTA